MKQFVHFTVLWHCLLADNIRSHRITSFEQTLRRTGYDKNIRPFMKSGRPVTVVNQINVLHLEEFRVDRFTYDIR